MSREPAVGVENSSQHFQAVSVQLEIMCDEQCDEPDHRTADTADPVFVEAFQDNTEQNRSPANKDRRAVKVCDRRAPLQIHTDNQTEGMDQKCTNEEDNRRL